jgi:hypothetical protein
MTYTSQGDTLFSVMLEKRASRFVLEKEELSGSSGLGVLAAPLSHTSLYPVNPMLNKKASLPVVFDSIIELYETWNTVFETVKYSELLS